MWRTIDQKLRSPALTIALICAVGLASVLGTIPVKLLETGTVGRVLSGLLRAIGAENLYHTWWYTSLLVFLASLMIYCSLRRLPSVIRAFAFIPDKAAWSREDGVATHSIPISEASRETVRKKVTRILRDRGYHARAASAEPADEAVLFDKGRAGVLGPLVVHLGLVVAFVGGLVTHNFGTVREIMLGEGETYTIPDTQTKLRLEKFSIVHHPGTREPEEYVSTLMVTGNDGAPSWHMLRVNQPLSVGGATLYQMRYRPDVRYVSLVAFKPATRSPVASIRLVPGKRADIAGRDMAVELKEIVPDFAIDSKNNVFSRSRFFLNPAAKVSVYSPARSEQPVWTGWAFKGIVPRHDSSSGPLTLAIERVSLKYYSGIKIVKDPGAAFAYFGFVLLVGGALVSCYMFRRFVRVEFDGGESGESGRIRVLSYSVKNRPDFVYEWNGLLAQLRKAIGE